MIGPPAVRSAEAGAKRTQSSQFAGERLTATKKTVEGDAVSRARLGPHSHIAAKADAAVLHLFPNGLRERQDGQHGGKHKPEDGCRGMVSLGGRAMYSTAKWGK
jgi:hypothetical protein